MADLLTDRRTIRRVATVAVVGLLILFSGCSAIGGDVGGSSDAETTTEESTELTTAAGETTTANDSAGDGHGHSHGNETTTEDSGETNATGDLSGKMTVAVAGTELPLDELASGEVSMAPGDEHTWQTSSNLTLAEALSSFGVEASAEQLSYDGTTYSEETNGTGIYYRVNGESVDPESYTLQDGDKVWVTVETADTNYSVPGTYIRANQQHIHGPMTFVVDGEEVDFSEERFQSGHRHFHFEGGHANPWHAHSWSITLQYGLNTLTGINVTEDSVTYNGTTYNEADADTNVSITVNGESVDPSEYLLKDGDDVRIVVEKNSS